MRKLSLLLILTLIAAIALAGAAADEELQIGDYYWGGYTGHEPSVSPGAPQLISLTHNCPNTGKMLPEYFNPSVTTYLLTVASWVSRVCFTPVASDPSAAVEVNGSIIRSGSSTSYCAQISRARLLVMVAFPYSRVRVAKSRGYPSGCIRFSRRIGQLFGRSLKLPHCA